MRSFATIAVICALLTVSVFADDPVNPIPAGPVTITTPDASGVVQIQSGLNSIGNSIVLNHGSEASNVVGLNVVDNQNTGSFPHVVADQTRSTDFWEAASACGSCGVINAAQSLLGGGYQYQSIGGSVDPKLQGQGTGLYGAQTVLKTEGQASSNLVQGGILANTQTATNSAGTMNESNMVTAAQVSTIAGTPGTTGQVGSTVYSQSVQSQMAY